MFSNVSFLVSCIMFNKSAFQHVFITTFRKRSADSFTQSIFQHVLRPVICSILHHVKKSIFQHGRVLYLALCSKQSIFHHRAQHVSRPVVSTKSIFQQILRPVVGSSGCYEKEPHRFCIYRRAAASGPMRSTWRCSPPSRCHSYRTTSPTMGGVVSSGIVSIAE